jgi:HSP20 family protein
MEVTAMTLVKYTPRWKAGTVTRNTRNDFNPSVDIVEGENAFNIAFDLPGIEKNDINILVNEGLLTVKGERKVTELSDEKYFRNFERPGGKFSRSFRLPDYVDENAIKASYKNGVLNLDLARKEEAKPRTIEVK